MAAHVRLSFLRRNAWPAGLRYHVLWNGGVASNGDGIPNADPSAAVDADNPLTPAPVEVWPLGKAGIGDEPAGDGVVGEPSNFGAGFGAADGAAGDAEAGLYGDRLSWGTQSVLPALRDGTYKFAIRFEDEAGTIQTDALIVATIVVAGVPRPPRNLQFTGYSGGSVGLSWTASPDM